MGSFVDKQAVRQSASSVKGRELRFQFSIGATLDRSARISPFAVSYPVPIVVVMEPALLIVVLIGEAQISVTDAPLASVMCVSRSCV